MFENSRNAFLSKVVETFQFQNSSKSYTDLHSSSARKTRGDESCDKTNSLSIMDTLVGRDHQLTLLQRIFDRVKNSEKSELVVICGTSGSGKSSLMHVFMQNLATKVLHSQGKFDQLQSDTPYSALISALDQLCTKILNSQNSTEICDRIRSSLGPDIQLLGTLIPKLIDTTAAVGTDINTSTLDSSIGESFSRFKVLFRTLIRSIASTENPMLLFLDDLHWADPASLEVLKSLVTDSLSRSLMIVCAYREGEMSVETLRKFHLVPGVKDEEDSASSSPAEHIDSLHSTDIFIDSLDATQLNHLISLKLDMAMSSTKSLSQLVMNKTGGNPFYVLNFLEMLLTNSLLRKGDGNDWTWDESQILCMTNVTDNLACILESKLQSLPEQVTSILQIASFIGHEFSASILFTIVHEEQDTIASEYSFQRQPIEIIQERIMSALKIALEEGILEKSHNKEEYKFAHDKIQEVLYETLMPDETERVLLHQRIGTLIWNSVKTIEKSKIDDWIIFLAAGNLNRALTIVHNSDDRYTLVELNLIASRRAIRKSAFLSAAKYLRNAVSLLASDSCWNEKYDLCLDVYNTAAETEKNVGCYSRSACLVALIHKHAKTLYHRSTAFAIEIDSLTIQGNIKGAVALGLDALCHLDIKFPRQIKPLVVLKEFISTKLVIGRKNLQDLLSYPKIKDEKVFISLSIMNLVAVNSFVLADIYKDTYATVCLRMLRLTWKHGISIYSPMAIVFWGSLNTILGRFDVSLECEKLALNIIDKYDMDCVRGVTTLISYGVNHFWRIKLDSEARKEFLQAYQFALRYGNTNVAQYGFVGWLSAAFYLDDQLSDVHRLTRSYVSEMREYDSQSGLMFILPIWQGLLNLCGDEENQDPSKLRGGALDESFAQKIEEIDSKLSLLNLYLVESIVSYVFDSDSYMGKNLWYLNKYEDAMQGYYGAGFMKTWLSLFHYESFLRTGRRIHKRLGRKSHRRVKHWSTTGTTMLDGPTRFLDAIAKLCVLKSSCDDLIFIFEEAADSCAAGHCYLFEALAYERLSTALKLGDPDLVNLHVYHNKAIEIYRKWGALTKANQVEEKFAPKQY